MPTNAQKRANYKYQQTEKYKEYKKQYMREYMRKKKLEQANKS
jgi:hypothetical protein